MCIVRFSHWFAQRVGVEPDEGRLCPQMATFPDPAAAGIAVNLAGGVWYGSLKFKPPPLKGSGSGSGAEAKHEAKHTGDDAEAGEGLLGGGIGGGGGQQPEAAGGTGAQYHLHGGHHRHPAGQ